MIGLRLSWQTLLADLALVLFIITAAAWARSNGTRSNGMHGRQASVLANAMPRADAAGSAPLAVYRDGPGAPTLGAWLAQQAPDARQQLTIVTHYTQASAPGLPARIAALLADARAAGTSPRLVIEPGPGGTSAGIGFDQVSSSISVPAPSPSALPPAATRDQRPDRAVSSQSPDRSRP